jgi:hypothetical protein
MIQNNVGDRRCLLSLVEKAYLVAIAFEEVVTKDWIVSYLNDNLPIDALCQLGLKCNMLHVDEEGPHIFSISHGNWLSKLRAAKLNVNKHVITHNNAIVEDLYEDFKKLQELSMFHPLLSACSCAMLE